MSNAFSEWLIRAGMFLLGIALVGLLFHSQEPPRGDAAEVLAVLLSQQDAWNAGDLERFMDYYDDGLTFFTGGDILTGRAALTARYRTRYQKEGKEMGRLTFSDLDAQLFGPDDAVVRGRWKVAMKDGLTPNGLFTLVMKRRADGWKVAHDHTSAADPPKKP